MLHQTFEPHDLLVICVLILLEGILSMDNALVLGLLARRLPEALRSKALVYGLVGALLFRSAAIGTASTLLRWHGAELIGGGYLAIVAVRHLLFSQKKTSGDTGDQAHAASFWGTVISIELTDVAFAIDSIVAALALVGRAPAGTPAGQLHPKLWVVIIGGMGGVVMMRFAAMLFIKLLERFPRFETSAYLLVLVIGLKMLIGYLMPSMDFQKPTSPEFWVFWGLMLCALAFGFLPDRAEAASR